MKRNKENISGCLRFIEAMWTDPETAEQADPSRSHRLSRQSRLETSGSGQLIVNNWDERLKTSGQVINNNASISLPPINNRKGFKVFSG